MLPVHNVCLSGMGHISVRTSTHPPLSQSCFQYAEVLYVLFHAPVGCICPTLKFADVSEVSCNPPPAVNAPEVKN